jgi:hypothetical protein
MKKLVLLTEPAHLESAATFAATKIALTRYNIPVECGMKAEAARRL